MYVCVSVCVQTHIHIYKQIKINNTKLKNSNNSFQFSSYFHWLKINENAYHFLIVKLFLLPFSTSSTFYHFLQVPFSLPTPYFFKEKFGCTDLVP